VAASVHLSVELAAPPAQARELVLDELRMAGLEPREDGDVVVIERETEEWEPAEHARAEIRFAETAEGTTVRVELVRDSELVGEWFVSEALVPLLRATGSDAHGDWLTDRRARRPSGAEAREVYGDPLYHWPNFRAILEELALTADESLLEVGCGGGAFLHEALKSGCSAAAIDHSRDMLRLARQQNAKAVAEGRLEMVEGDAAALPFADSRFTAAVMTGVLGFLPDAVTAFAEIRRVLQPGGRFVALGADPALKGTPAAPEPMASRLAFYTDAEHEQFGREAGFEEVEVKRISLIEHAREAGVPEEHLPLFGGTTPFLVARKH
jgi:SAM-dependent methyltransferase